MSHAPVGLLGLSRLKNMSDPEFFPDARHISLGEIASLAGIPLPDGVAADRMITAVAPLETAGSDAIAYMDNPQYVASLEQTRAGVCLIASRFAARVPANTVALVTPQPYRVFAMVIARMFPSAMRPQPYFATGGVSPGAVVHPEARLEAGVSVDPGAIVAAGVEVGAGSVIGANAVIGPGVRIGRDAAIGPGASVMHTLIGNRVIIHGGVRIGQDGFGFAMGPQGHLKVPQIGRVIIQDDVEIGANTTIDRGANRDTIIGEGTKIDNLVQIGHNVVIGRHCVIVSQVGIAGSTTVGDFVALGGKVGVVGHVHIGDGAQVAASSNVATDVPAGARWAGTPAQPIRDWMREILLLKKMVGRQSASGQTPEQ